LHVADVSKKFGKYGKYFEESENLLQKYDDKWDKHKTLVNFEFGFWCKYTPKIFSDVYIASSATITGNVEVFDNASIWYGCVIKGDIELVRIGCYANIQEGTVITESLKPLAPDHDGSTIVGHFVTVGHHCNLRGCTIEENCVVGPNSVLMEGAYMENNSELAANSVLHKNQRVPTGQLWGGNPAIYVRDLTEIEVENLKETARDNYRYAYLHRQQFYLPNNLHKEVEKKHFPIGAVRPLPG